VPSKVAALPLPAGFLSGLKKFVAQVIPLGGVVLRPERKLSSKPIWTNIGTCDGERPPGGLCDQARWSPKL
jgi:hypothetical protein